MKENFWENPAPAKKDQDKKEISGVVGKVLEDFKNNKELIVDLLKGVILEKNGATTPREALKEVFLSYIKEKYPIEDISKATEVFDGDRKTIANLFCREFLEASSLIQKEAKNKRTIFKGRPVSSNDDLGLKKIRYGGQDYASGDVRRGDRE